MATKGREEEALAAWRAGHDSESRKRWFVLGSKLAHGVLGEYPGALATERLGKRLEEAMGRQRAADVNFEGAE